MSSDVRSVDFKSDKQPTWCPGCRNFETMNSIMKTLANSSTDPDNAFMVAGISCSGEIRMYVRSYVVHGVHGCSPPITAGVKLANLDLTVVVVGGDSDDYSIDVGHFIHAVHHSVDTVYTVMDNCIHGFTEGQASSASRRDFKISTTSEGPQQPPVNLLVLSLTASGTFIARSFAMDHKRHVEIVQEAIEHDGSGFVNVFSPCVTFSDVDTYDCFRDNLVDLADINHNLIDYDTAREEILDSSKGYGGIIYKDESSVSCEEKFDVSQDILDISSSVPDGAMDLVREFY